MASNIASNIKSNMESKMARYTPYRKGRQFEYQVKHMLEKLGFKVFRCARSMPIDLIAFHPNMKPILIECKLTDNIDKKQVEVQKQLAQQCNAEYLLITRQNLKDVKRQLLAKIALTYTKS